MSKRGRRRRAKQQPHKDQYAAQAAVAQAKQAADHAKYMENLRVTSGVQSATTPSTPQSTSEESPQ